MVDPYIIDRCRNGDLQYFGKLVEKVSPFAFSAAFRILCDEEDAKDVVQETMVTLWKKLKNLDSPHYFKTWLYRIVINKCNDHLRNKNRKHEYRPDEQDWERISNLFAERPSRNLENDESERILRALTNRLSPMQKTVFVLSELEEMSGDEIAEITGMSKTTIKSNLYHARKHIAQMIEKLH